MSDIPDTNKVMLRKTGNLEITEDGQPVVVAHYERQTGHLEFSTKEYSVKFYNQVTARIGTVANGTQPSSLVIKSVGVKGEERPKVAKDAPKRPRMGPLGDTAEDIVQWYLENDMAQAIIRYGLYLDAKGKPIRKKVRRVLENTIDQRDVDDVDLEQRNDGRSSKVKAPVSRQHEVIEQSDGYIARRATALTFVPQEVVGGFTPEEEDDQPAYVGQGEETDQ